MRLTIIALAVLVMILLPVFAGGVMESRDNDFINDEMDFIIWSKVLFPSLSLSIKNLNVSGVLRAEETHITNTTVIDVNVTNNMDIAGYLNVAGNVTINESLSVAKNLTIDHIKSSGSEILIYNGINVSSTLFVDVINNNVGINRFPTTEEFEVSGNIWASKDLKLQGGTDTDIELKNTDGTDWFTVCMADGPNVDIASPLGNITITPQDFVEIAGNLIATNMTSDQTITNHTWIGKEEGDHYIYFYEDGNPAREYLRWNNVDDRFDFSDELTVTGNFYASNDVRLTSKLDSDITFYDGIDGAILANMEMRGDNLEIASTSEVVSLSNNNLTTLGILIAARLRTNSVRSKSGDDLVIIGEDDTSIRSIADDVFIKPDQTPGSYGDLHLDGLQKIRLGDNSPVGNIEVWQYGNISDSAKYIWWELGNHDDTWFDLERQDTTVSGFRINMPMSVANNLTAENVWLPTYCFAHTDDSQNITGTGVWLNISFDEEASFCTHITHDYASNALNDTFIIQDEGVYDISYHLTFSDTAPSPSGHVEMRVTRNSTEIAGSLLEEDSSKQYNDFTLTNGVIVTLAEDDEIRFQFTADDTTIGMSSHAQYGDHKDTGVIKITRIG